MLWTLSLRPCSLRCLSRPQCRCFSSSPLRLRPRHIATEERSNTTSAKLQSGDAQPKIEAEEPRLFYQRVGPPSIRNQVLFFVFGSLLAFGVAARQTNLDTYYWTNKLTKSSFWTLGTSVTPTNGDIQLAKRHDLLTKAKTWLNKLQSSGLSDQLRAMAAYSYAQVVLKYLDTTEGKRVCYMLAAANGVVWAVWQIPRMEGFMLRTFAHHPLSGLSYTMLTSTFSHSAFIHLLFNMMALLSFGSSADMYLTIQQRADPSNLRESTSRWHFLSFFISAGLFSSLVSHVATARIKYPQLIAQLAHPAKTAAPAASIAEGAAAARSTSALTGSEALASIKPSLGASGAIYATVTLTAMAFPEAHISLIFPPTPPIPIQYGVFGFMAMDLMGVIRGWRLFDHYAHLGGAMFGLWYYAYGPKVWESFREMTLGGLPRSLQKA